jgi:hypothetical protein
MGVSHMSDNRSNCARKRVKEVWPLTVGILLKELAGSPLGLKVMKSRKKLIEFNGKIPYVFDYEKS